MGLAYATASEDMDTLTFGCNLLLRGFNSKKEPITQIDLSVVLQEFKMNMNEFIDLCIMCGCDYTNNIGGIGPTTAFRIIEENRDIESALSKINRMNSNPSRRRAFIVPDSFEYEEARKLFKEPRVCKDEEELK